MPGVEALRQIAIALPQVEERDHFGTPSWRIDGKIFAQMAQAQTANTAILKLPRARQDILFEVRPETFTPAVWGRLVWCTINLDRIETGELAALVRSAWLEVAPKRLAAAYLSATHTT